MRLYEQWQEEYRAKRYLEHASEDQLRDRVFDIISNDLVLTLDNKIGVLDHGIAGHFWQIRLSDVMEECRLRGHGMPSISTLASEGWCAADNVAIPEVEAHLESLSLQAGQYMLKLAKREHNEAALGGTIMLSSASSLDDAQKRRAVRDRELERAIYRSSARLGELGVVDPNPQGDLAQVTVQSETDYYVYCVTLWHQRRLFRDFDADSALLIKDPETFIQRLTAAFLGRRPDFEVESGQVRYFDPFTDGTQTDVAFSKPFAFAYQCEFRVVFWPTTLAKRLEPIFVEVGDLRDIAELIV